MKRSPLPFEDHPNIDPNVLARSPHARDILSLVQSPAILDTQSLDDLIKIFAKDGYKPGSWGTMTMGGARRDFGGDHPQQGEGNAALFVSRDNKIACVTVSGRGQGTYDLQVMGDAAKPDTVTDDSIGLIVFCMNRGPAFCNVSPKLRDLVGPSGPLHERSQRIEKELARKNLLVASHIRKERKNMRTTLGNGGYPDQ